jgi:F-type H+-transporting ATPase subunit gamma
MKRSNSILRELTQITTIEGLAGVFEGIASMQIAKIKDQVVSSQQFFTELWQIYSQLRANPDRQIDRSSKSSRQLFVVLTSEGGLSGDVDERIITWMLKQYDPDTADIMVMGGHGANLLRQKHIQVAKVFKLPEGDESLAIGPIAGELSRYGRAAAFYQTYVSLAVQQVARIDLISAVKALGAETAKGEEIISSHNYDFEPSVEEVIDYMESIMLSIALGQVILESKLAQAASRFNAMSSAQRKAREIQSELRISYRRGKRAESDDRAKEIINSLRSTHAEF